jgi:hypothetical protein
MLSERVLGISEVRDSKDKNTVMDRRVVGRRV